MRRWLDGTVLARSSLFDAFASHERLKPLKHVRPLTRWVPDASPRGSSCQRRAGLVEGSRHRPDQGCAIDGHWETRALRSARFRSWLRHQYYEKTGGVPGAGAIRRTLICSKPELSSMGRGAPSTPEPQNMRAASSGPQEA